ncbi:hypothetical protein P3X46_006782 [Hevea brasiliensis]|uniref:Uncharacterized protein n=1 Tax=Hevea brasiliensis TaxID=3981 RepID=A0ABQ9MTT9_HEVBR|nr:uncharacterized protein LOC110667905 isoform X1 [Hevea brasiliensis]KAJ9182832.1 hypothetical protein P3X46_006782 [Hevea brasiliensis]
MTNAIKMGEARKLKEQDRQDNKIGQILTNLAKFAVDSTANGALKGVTGPKKFYKFVQERLQNPPTSLPLNNCKKPADVKLVEEMQIKVEEMLEDMAKLKQQNETSAKCMEGTKPVKKGPNEGSRKLDVLEPEKKRIFIRSRL